MIRLDVLEVFTVAVDLPASSNNLLVREALALIALSTVSDRGTSADPRIGFIDLESRVPEVGDRLSDAHLDPSGGIARRCLFH